MSHACFLVWGIHTEAFIGCCKCETHISTNCSLNATSMHTTHQKTIDDAIINWNFKWKCYCNIIKRSVVVIFFWRGDKEKANKIAIIIQNTYKMNTLYSYRRKWYNGCESTQYTCTVLSYSCLYENPIEMGTYFQCICFQMDEWNGLWHGVFAHC